MIFAVLALRVVLIRLCKLLSFFSYSFIVTTIYGLFYRATADRHMYDGGNVSSFDSHFANIGDRHEISTLINVGHWRLRVIRVWLVPVVQARRPLSLIHI